VHANEVLSSLFVPVHGIKTSQGSELAAFWINILA